MPRGRKAATTGPKAGAYAHPTEHPIRPDIGIEPQFKGHKPPVTYRFDKSLDPQLAWDPQAQRDEAEELLSNLRRLAAQASDAGTPEKERNEALARIRTTAEELQGLSKPFLTWTGKAERPEVQVPTVPLFVHERLSTRAVLESVRGMKRSKAEQLDLFGDPGFDIADRVLKAYEHKAPWTNRLILGDSLVAMNSLLEYEGLGGQVQMIYMDPPYGVKFNSNFQPFVRNRDVVHNSDDDLTREPEMVRAYRDTWELGTHSYLTYLRDRLFLARELLSCTGSAFVQISDENLHLVRSIMDEVFGSQNFVTVINFVTANAQTGRFVENNCNYLVWYAKDKVQAKSVPCFLPKSELKGGANAYRYVDLPDGTRRAMTADEKAGTVSLPQGSRIFRADKLASSHPPGSYPVEFEGRTFTPGKGYWSTGQEGMERLKAAKRLIAVGNTLSYVRYVEDFPAFAIGAQWNDTITAGFTSDKLYVVQTNAKVVERCMLMTTDPGDLVLDPTCGSGTTAYVAERWGRRWITVDVSRVPLALARQRLLTATYPWYALKNPDRGPESGFVYERKQNRRGQEVGGLVPHVMLESIAKGEEPEIVTLVHLPKKDDSVVRVTGPFTVEAVIPAAVTADDAESVAEDHTGYQAGESDGHARLLEALRRTPIRLPRGEVVSFRQVRPPARSANIHAEAETGPEDAPQPVAFSFGPNHAPVTESLIWNAAKEANARSYSALYVVGFAIEDAATRLINESQSVLPLPVRYVSASMDLQMGDLLKDSRSSEVFAAIGAPEIKLLKLKKAANGEAAYCVELLGVDVFDPSAIDSNRACDHKPGNDVPCWMLDTDYDELTFRASQVFFPRTGAWDKLQKALRGVYDDTLWDHLAGAVSQPFPTGDRGRIAVKVIDDRGNELLVSRSLSEAVPEP